MSGGSTGGSGAGGGPAAIWQRAFTQHHFIIVLFIRSHLCHFLPHRTPHLRLHGGGAAITPLAPQVRLAQSRKKRGVSENILLDAL
jgi:hypothetical protein